jgi:hypothetical protein
MSPKIQPELHRGDAAYLRGLDCHREAVVEILGAWPSSKWSHIRLVTPVRAGDGSIVMDAGVQLSMPKYRLEPVRA